MRAVVQRVSTARVSVGGEVTGSIGAGLLVFLGVHKADTPEDLEWLAGKVGKARIFDDADGKMNRSAIDNGLEALLISQFTLIGNVRKGTRPSFNDAAAPEIAEASYLQFRDRLGELLGKPVPTGRFAQYMIIEAVNDGPVTLVIDSHARA